MEKTDPSKYRPISLLPNNSKVIERVIHDQTNTFFLENVLYNFPSRFKPNHSTNLYLSYLTYKILKRFDECLLNGIILIDLQKVFEFFFFSLKNSGKFSGQNL